MSKRLEIGIAQAPVQELTNDFLNTHRVRLCILREDLNHPLIQGNKFRKLKYNLIKAKAQGKHTLLTFGGAFSNHIHAVAAAGKVFNFKTIGIIRGDELAYQKRNVTLQQAEAMGMRLQFITRSDYRRKTDLDFISNLRDLWGDFYLIPEGGTNELAIKGCKEILSPETQSFKYIACAMGTAGTFTGMLESTLPTQTLLGFPALKDYEYLTKTIKQYSQKTNYEIINAFHFGGFGKFNQELISFVNKFKAQFNILLEPLYTGKMMYGLFQLIEKGYFPANSSILAVHTGGLQGIKGFNERYINKYNIET